MKCVVCEVGTKVVEAECKWIQYQYQEMHNIILM